MTLTRSPRHPVVFRAALFALSVLLYATIAGAVADDYAAYLHWTSVVRGEGVGEYRDVTLAGDRLYAARFDGGVQILSTVDPARPAVLGGISGLGDVLGIAVSGDIAYVAAGDDGLQVLDCSDPGAPQVIGSTSLSGPASGVVLDGSIAYVCCGEIGLVPVDVSMPGSPAPDLPIDTPGTALQAALMDDHVAVADGVSGVQFVSRATGSLVSAADTPGLALSVAVDGDVVLVADYYAGLTVVDASSISAPEVVASIPSSPGVLDVATRDGLALLANANAGLVVTDVSDPDSPVHIASLSTGGLGYGVALNGDHVYLADTGDLNTYALGSGTTVPVLDYLGFEAPRFAAYRRLVLLVVDGDRIWTIDTTTGETLGVGATLFDPCDLVLGDGYAYVADAGAGVRTVDVTDPARPDVRSGLYVGGDACGLALDGDRLHAAVSGLGLVVMDLSADPGAPAIMGLCGTTGDPRDVAVLGDTVFLATLGGGLWSIDVSDPASPVPLDQLHTGHDIHHVATSGDHVYAVDDTNLFVYDASQPDELALVTTRALRGPLRDIAAAGDLVYVVDPYIGLYVIDVSTPAAPAVIGGGISSSFFLSSMVLSPDRLFLVDGLGVFVMPVHGVPTNVDGPPRPGPRLAVAPNPFNPRTTVTFALDAPGPARVDVHDLAGRRVATLADRAFAAGTHVLTWDGADDDGRALPSGVYVARLRTAVGERSRKMTLVR